MSNTVGDLMTPHVIAASENTEYKEIAGILRRHNVSAIPIVDSDRRVVGVVSEADLLLKFTEPSPEEGYLLESHQARIERRKHDAHTARDLMTVPPVTITAEATPQEAVERMRRNHVKRLPVVNEDGRLAGIVSRLDLLHVYSVDDERLQRMLLHDTVRGEFGLVDVEVLVRDGVVTLVGRTPRRSDIPRLSHAVRETEGVVRVRSELDYAEDDLILLSGRH